MRHMKDIISLGCGGVENITKFGLMQLSLLSATRYLKVLSPSRCCFSWPSLSQFFFFSQAAILTFNNILATDSKVAAAFVLP